MVQCITVCFVLLAIFLEVIRALKCPICSDGGLMTNSGATLPAGLVSFYAHDKSCFNFELMMQVGKYNSTNCYEVRLTNASEICGCPSEANNTNNSNTVTNNTVGSNAAATNPAPAPNPTSTMIKGLSKGATAGIMIGTFAALAILTYMAAQIQMEKHRDRLAARASAIAASKLTEGSVDTEKARHMDDDNSSVISL